MTKGSDMTIPASPKRGCSSAGAGGRDGFGNLPGRHLFTRADLRAWRSKVARLVALIDRLESRPSCLRRDQQIAALRRMLARALALRDEVQRAQPETKAW